MRCVVCRVYADISIAASKAGLQFVDVSVAMSSILADKDADEIVSFNLPATS